MQEFKPNTQKAVQIVAGKSINCSLKKGRNNFFQVFSSNSEILTRAVRDD